MDLTGQIDSNLGFKSLFPPPKVWLFNFNAEETLHEDGGSNFKSSKYPKKFGQKYARLWERIVPKTGLAKPQDLVLPQSLIENGNRFELEKKQISELLSKLSKNHQADSINQKEPLFGHAWMQTEKARHLFLQLGITPSWGKAQYDLKALASRTFYSALNLGQKKTYFVKSETELQQVLATQSEIRLWFLKRDYSCAGRNKRRLEVGLFNDDTLRWAHAVFQSNLGIEMCPFADIIAEYSIHGYLDREQNYTCGKPVRQFCSTSGTWLRSSPCDQGELTKAEIESLHHALETVAAKLSEAGYVGPFGIDAFRQIEKGKVLFSPCSEINVRYTMSWALGMGT